VGDRRLRVDARLAAADRGRARGSDRAPAGLLDRARPVHGDLAALRPLAERQVPDLRSGRSGNRWRDHVRDLTGPTGAGVPRARAGDRVRGMGGDDRACCSGRAAARRCADGDARLVVDLLHQRPDRDCGRRADAREGRRVSQPGSLADRLGRNGHVHRGVVRRSCCCSEARACCWSFS
jgi:hypothetical protein